MFSSASGVWRLVAGGDFHYWVMKVPKFRGGRVLVASGRVSWRKAECGRVVPKRPIVIAECFMEYYVAIYCAKVHAYFSDASRSV